MAIKTGISTKRVLIDKTNSTVVIITSLAAFITIFSLVASKTLFSQAGYQNRVIKQTRQAVDQLRTDVKNTKDLTTSYNKFANQDLNVIGGNAHGNGVKDGNNTAIVLDALPSSYDFPALATSLESLITANQGLAINSITGTDDEVNQSTNLSSATPESVPMPFQLSVEGDYGSIQTLINSFEHSIRPFQVQSMDLEGDQDKLTLNMTAQTFYQPAKSLNITTTVVK